MCAYCYVKCVQPQSSVGTYKAPIKTLQKVLPNRLQLRIELAPLSRDTGAGSKDDG